MHRVSSIILLRIALSIPPCPHISPGQPRAELSAPRPAVPSEAGVWFPLAADVITCFKLNYGRALTLTHASPLPASLHPARRGLRPMLYSVLLYFVRFFLGPHSASVLFHFFFISLFIYASTLIFSFRYV